MRFVYAVGFIDDLFLMVYNPSRDGWEMPGGQMELNESPEEAIEREYLEESGHIFVARARRDMNDIVVFSGIIKRKGDGEMDWALFNQLPDRLSFPEVEYKEIISWARENLDNKKDEIAGTTKT
jgi:predicted NUDIX family NTP pyrophosphohydrolase